VRALATIALFIALSGCASNRELSEYDVGGTRLGSIDRYELTLDDRRPDKIRVLVDFSVDVSGNAVGPLVPPAVSLVSSEGVRYEPLRSREIYYERFSTVRVESFAFEFGRPCQPEDLVAVEASVGDERRRFDLTR
jgi:hypothetical protein